uniref:GST N-terminal domain-containing protein n=1 Tax=Heligmosomoides polygyrus TaxID=6339 RepID=A0A183FG21_HELPZ
LPHTQRIPPLGRFILTFSVCHGETVDEVFPQWTRLSFHSGKYRPYDLNMPAVIPKRPIKYYKNDPPLTEYGGLTAEFMGHGIKMAGYKPEVIFSSPELRCVQTAAAISHAFGKPEPMIHIEPALAEWVQINPNSASEWLTLAGLGYPICGGQEATQLPKRESPEDYSRRLTNFFKSISQPSSPDQCVSTYL